MLLFLHCLLLFPPAPGVSDLRVNLNSVQATSAIVNWTRTPGTSYFLTVEYIGPCVGANVASQRRVVDDRIQGDYELTGLQPHSQYLVNVWPTESVTNASVLVLTATASEFGILPNLTGILEIDY